MESRLGSGNGRKKTKKKHDQQRMSLEQEMKLSEPAHRLRPNAKHLEDETDDVGDECRGVGDAAGNALRISGNLRAHAPRCSASSAADTQRERLAYRAHCVRARINTRSYACIQIGSLNASSVTVRGLGLRPTEG